MCVILGLTGCNSGDGIEAAAQIRYYINPTTGETYVTEYAEGITPEEESLNVRDYLQ